MQIKETKESCQLTAYTDPRSVSTYFDSLLLPSRASLWLLQREQPMGYRGLRNSRYDYDQCEGTQAYMIIRFISLTCNGEIEVDGNEMSDIF